MPEPINTCEGLEKAYRQMASDAQRESEALEWVEATVSDVADDPWQTCDECHEQESQ